MSEQTKSCPCKHTECNNHGDCVACKGYHRSTDSQTGCEKAAAREAASKQQL